MFDDGVPSHWQMAIPALQQRKLVATFYLNPGKGEYLKFHDKWEQELWKTGAAVYGNHTMTHSGVKDVANAEYEIGEANAAVLKASPGKVPRLISFALPGVKPGAWNITADQLKVILDKNHLIERPPFKGHGAVYHMQTAEDMLKLADQAIAKKGMEYLVIHGVERRGINWGYQDFWPLNYDVFLKVLDGLQSHQASGALWITDHISWHKYVTERDSAQVAVVKSGPQGIELRLTSKADPQLYDQPLSLTTTVPASWTAVQLSGGSLTPTRLAPKNGQVTWQAIPGPALLKLEPSKG